LCFSVKKTSAFHQEFLQPERNAQDQTFNLTESSPFSVSPWMFSLRQLVDFFNSVGSVCAKNERILFGLQE
jgi:hypothetical protein